MCDMCNQTFDRSTDLNEHLKQHVGLTHSCNIPGCDMKYATLNSLKKHRHLHMKKGMSRRLCKYCGKSCTGNTALWYHEMTHRGTKDFECDQCPKRFTTPLSLKAHKKCCHEGFRYYCSKCPKSFRSQGTRDRHEVVHTGIKEFNCDMCEMAFYTDRELIRHKKNHLVCILVIVTALIFLRLINYSII